MANCVTCTNPCTCTLFTDGLFAGSPELGRNFTAVEGTGSTDDPYVIHFYDQNEFRPKSAEITWKDVILPNNIAQPNVLSFTPFGSYKYQSPINFIIKTVSDIYLQSNFFVIGCSVTFAETADSGSSGKRIQLKTYRGPVIGFTTVVIGGQTVAAGGGDPMTLSCQTFHPGLLQVDPSLTKPVTIFQLEVFQNSGSDILLSDIRIWMSQI